MRYNQPIEPVDLLHRASVLMRLAKEHDVDAHILSMSAMCCCTYALITIEGFRFGLSTRADVDVTVKKLSKTSATHIARWNIDGMTYEFNAHEDTQS